MLKKKKTIEKRFLLQEFGLYTTKKRGTITFKPTPIHIGFMVISRINNIIKKNLV